MIVVWHDRTKNIYIYIEIDILYRNKENFQQSASIARVSMKREDESRVTSSHTFYLAVDMKD